MVLPTPGDTGVGRQGRRDSVDVPKRLGKPFGGGAGVRGNGGEGRGRRRREHGSEYGFGLREHRVQSKERCRLQTHSVQTPVTSPNTPGAIREVEFDAEALDSEEEDWVPLRGGRTHRSLRTSVILPMPLRRSAGRMTTDTVGWMLKRVQSEERSQT